MKKIHLIILIGIFIRLIVAAFASHPDFRAVNLAANLISQKGELLTFYDHISKLPRENHLVKLYHDDLFIYPPLAYLSHAVFNLVLNPLYPKSTFELLISDYGRAVVAPDFWILSLLLKLPYLVADLLCAVVLVKLVSKERSIVATSFWMLNPVLIYSSFGVGQFDIFISLFILASIYFSKQKRIFSPILLGVAAGFKPFPLFLLPFLPGNIFKNLVVGVTTYFLIIAPYLHSPAFKQYALLANLTDNINYSKILVSGSQYLSLFYVGFGLLVLYRFHSEKKLEVHEWFFSLLAWFFSVTHFHPQWFVWILPSLALIWTNRKDLQLILLAFQAIYLLIVLSFDSSLNFGLFGVNFDIYKSVSVIVPKDQIVSLLRSLLLALSVYAFSCFGQKVKSS